MNGAPHERNAPHHHRSKPIWRTALPAGPAHRVKDVRDRLAAGASRHEILQDHPMLEDGDITAALESAARHTDHPVLHVA